VLFASLALACGPIGRFPGGPLTGDRIYDPVDDWSFTDDHRLIQVEVRPAFPHSVTTVCFQHEGTLYVPARNAPSKRWTRFAIEDPYVRVRIDGRVYALRAVRETDPAEIEKVAPALLAKYDFPAPEGGVPPDLWFYRMESR
jgi:hypothetical protein